MHASIWEWHIQNLIYSSVSLWNTQYMPRGGITTLFCETACWFNRPDQWDYSTHPNVPPSPLQTSQSATPLGHGGRATQVTQKKIEGGGKKNSWACYGLRVKETRISTLLYQLNQYLWIEHTQVLRQVEFLTAKLFRSSSENNPPFSLSPSLRLPQLSFQTFCSLFLSLGKRWTLVLFLFWIFALIVVFTLVVPDGFAQWYSGGVLWGNSWCKWG